MGDGRGRILCFILGNLHVRTRVTPADLAVLVARVHELPTCAQATNAAPQLDPDAWSDFTIPSRFHRSGRRRAAPLTSGVSSAEGEVPRSAPR